MGSAFTVQADNYVKLQDGHKKLTLRYVKRYRVPPNLKIYQCCEGCRKHNAETIYAYHWAAAHCDKDTFHYLLRRSSLQEEYDASVNIRTKSLKTPLIYAAIHDKPANVRILIVDLRCEVNSRDSQGQTALHHAARLGHLDVVRELLLCPETNVNVLDHCDNTALEEAIHYNQKEVAECLKSRGGASTLDIRTNSWRRSFRSYTSTLDSGLQELIRDTSSSCQKFSSLCSSSRGEGSSSHQSMSLDQTSKVSQVWEGTPERTDSRSTMQSNGIAFSAEDGQLAIEADDEADEPDTDDTKGRKRVGVEQPNKVDDVILTISQETNHDSETGPLGISHNKVTKDKGDPNEAKGSSTKVERDCHEGSKEKDEPNATSSKENLKRTEHDSEQITVTAEVYSESGVVNCYDRKLENHRLSKTKAEEPKHIPNNEGSSNGGNVKKPAKEEVVDNNGKKEGGSGNDSRKQSTVSDTLDWSSDSSEMVSVKRSKKNRKGLSEL